MRYEPTVRNGDVTQGDPRPSEVTTYRLTAEELAKYGPPAAAKRRRALDISKWTRGGDKSMIDKTRTCRKCGEDKPAESFRPGWAICNDCAAPKPSPAVIDYAAQHGINLEVTGTCVMIVATAAAAVDELIDVLPEGRRYKLSLSVEEAPQHD